MRRRDLLVAPLLGRAAVRRGLTLGAYGSPRTFWGQGARVFAEFPAFNGAGCVTRFRKEAGVRVSGDGARRWAGEILTRHERAWREWRCAVVVDFARRCRAILDRHAPRMLLGNFQCAWRDDEHGGARLRTLGLDLPALAKTVDVLSPMVYHGRWLAGGSTSVMMFTLPAVCEDPGKMAVLKKVYRGLAA